MIRLATIDDLDQVVEVYNDAKNFLKTSGLTQWNGANEYIIRPIFEKYIQNKVLYVAVVDNRVAGVIAYTDMDHEYDNPYGSWLTCDDCYMTIHKLCVMGFARCHGLATKLMQYAEVYAKEKGYVSIRIDTHPANLIVQTMLRSLGYTNCGYILRESVAVEPKRLIFEKLVK